MGKIGDLWVRLGLKSDDYKKGIKEANKQTEGFGSKLGKMKAGAIAVWAAVGTAVVTFAKDFIGATNKMADRWEQNMSRLKASYHTFLAELSNTSIDTSGEGGKLGNWFKNEVAWWKRLFGNTKEAGDAAAEMTRAFDAEFELVNSVKLQKAGIQQELNELYVMMRDTTLSPQARKAAMERYKALLAPIAQAEIEVYGNMMNEAVKAWQAGAGLSREYSAAEVTDFLSMYGTDAAGATAKYGELASVYENRKGDEQNKVLVDTALKYQQALNEMSNLDKEMARITLQIKKSLADMFLIEGKTPDVYAQQIFSSLKEQMKADLQEIEDIEIDADIDLGLDDIDQEIKDFLSKWQQDMQQIEALNGMLENSIIAATQNGMQAITDMMFGLEGADMKQVLAAFLTPFADTLKQMGSMIMAEGIAMEAFKKSFTNPIAAIAAGAALMAIGSAVSSGLQALTANPTGGTSASRVGNSVSGATGIETYEQKITVEVTGEIAGDKIVLAGQKTINKWNR